MIKLSKKRKKKNQRKGSTIKKIKMMIKKIKIITIMAMLKKKFIRKKIINQNKNNKPEQKAIQDSATTMININSIDK